MRHNLFPAGFPSIKQQGFSMLEILITLVIVATALFGTAGLQVHAMRMNKGSEFRTQAVFLASDIAERMEANKVAGVTGNYAVASTNIASVAPVDCANVVCAPAQLASWDISQWETAIVNLKLPQASWQITQTQFIAASPPLDPLNSITYEIVIRWTDRRADTAYAANETGSITGLSSDGKAELFFHTSTRTLNN